LGRDVKGGEFMNFYTSLCFKIDHFSTNIHGMKGKKIIPADVVFVGITRWVKEKKSKDGKLCTITVACGEGI
jgi:hypothetical protein